MSKNNNVNPGQYKVAGRERQGEDIVPEQEKAALRQTQHELQAKSGPQGSRDDRRSNKGTARNDAWRFPPT